MTDLKRKILNDLRVELSEEFDRNFQRKAFFDRPWPPRKMNGKGSLLMVTGKLRRSIRCRVDAVSVVWETSERYAATQKLKDATDRFFYIRTTLDNGNEVILHVGRYKDSGKLYLYSASKELPEYARTSQ